MRSSACTTSRLLRPGHRRRSGRRWSGTHLEALLDKPVPEGPPHPRSVLVRLHRPDEMPSPPEYHRAADGSTSVVTRRGEGGIDVVVEGAFARALTDAVEGDED